MATTIHYKGPLRGPRHVMLATPTYTGKLDAGYAFSLLHSMDRLRAENISFEHYVVAYNCHVDDARNGVLRDFMLSDCTELVFLDADVVWEPSDLIKLIKHDRDIVAGVYPKRKADDTEFPVRVPPDTVLQADSDGLVEVEGAPTGFMKIKRHVIQKFFEANKHRRFYGVGASGNDEPYTLVFERTFSDGLRASGDYAFCLQWKKMGGKVFVDPYMRLSHVGETSFTGTLADYWKKKHGVYQMERDLIIKESITALKNGNPDMKVFTNLFEAWNNPFAASPELLASLYFMAKSADGDILETGTGLSTIVMACANPNVTIHALEHELMFAAPTKYFLDVHGIENVKMHVAPLKQYAEGKWYDVSEFQAKKVSLALCDGPPRKISNRSIFYRELGEQIADAVVIMDDADDSESVEPIKNWAEGLNRRVEVMGNGRRFAVSPRAAHAQ